MAAFALALGAATAAGAAEEDSPLDSGVSAGTETETLPATLPAEETVVPPLEGVIDAAEPGIEAAPDDAPAPAPAPDVAPDVEPAPAAIPGQGPTAVASGSISGTVTRDADGTPISGVTVSANGQGSGWPTSSAVSDQNGAYTLNGLAEDSYVVSFLAEGTDFMREYWQGVTDFGAATPVVITGGAPVAGIDASLSNGGVIEGSVTRAEDGSAVAAADVSALNANNEIVASTQADSSGGYHLGGLPAGSYRVRFGSPDPELASEYWSNAYSWDAATLVTVVEQQTAMNVDAALDSVGYISGTVTKSADGTPVLGSVMVSGVDREARFAFVGSDGGYRVAVAPGTYVVSFDAFDPGLLDEYWDDATVREAAASVIVESGGDVTGIDAQLAAAATISGTVTMASTENREMLVEAWVGGDRVAYVIADSQTGSYSLALPAGTYILKASATFYDSRTTAEPQFYDGVATADLATPVTAVASTTVGGIDFELAPVTQPEPQPEPEPEPEPQPTLTLSSGSVRAGGTVDLSGTGFAPGERVTLELRSIPLTLGVVVADSAGALTGSFRIPSGATAGAHTIVALNAQA